MSEPTIDEPLTIDDMLGWLGQMAADGNDCGAIPAICAILEQHRNVVCVVTSTGTVPTISAPTALHREIAEELRERKQSEIEAIRAFVERVKARGRATEVLPADPYEDMNNELAAMEAEVKQ